MRTYTDDEKANGLRLFKELGPSEAARQSGIPKGTLGDWARKAGIKSQATQKTRAATEARAAKNAELREELRGRLLKRAIDLDKRIDQKHKEFRGQQAKEVWYDSAPSDAVRAYVWSIGVLIDKMRLENGEPAPAPAKSNEGEEAKSQIGEYVAALKGAAREAWAGEGEKCEE